MILKQYTKEQLRDVIKKYFSMDKDLITTYHLVSGTDLDTCVNQTIKDLDIVDSSFKFYEILGDAGEEIGYFGSETYGFYLTTIFVNPKCRNKQNMKEIWNLIRKNLTPTFKTAIYKKNTRAVNFYLKNSGKVIYEGINNNTPFVLLEFKEV